MLGLLLGLAVAVAAPGPKDAPKKDPPSILGEWIPESAVMAGKPDLPPPGTTFTFTKDGQCVVKEGKDGKPDPIGYTIDTKKEPAEMNMMERGGMNSKPMKGIFKIEGDTLTICFVFDGERPKEFASPVGTQSMLLVLKRAKKD